MHKFLFLFAILIGSADAFCATVEYINSDKFGNKWTIRNDVVIGDGINLAVKDINIAGSSVLVNYGNITSSVNVCDNCDVYVLNRGNFDGKISVGDNSEFYQIIKKDSDISYLDVDGDINVLVIDADMVSLPAVMSLGATKVILNNSSVYLSPGVASFGARANSPIEIVGTVTVHLDDFDNLTDVPLMTNISGGGTVAIMSDAVDRLHALTGYLADGNLYAKLIRETDYVKILNNDVGKFLNLLRGDSPDDKLLAALDAADDMDELNAIMARSVRLHPIKLMNPVRGLYRFGDYFAPMASDAIADFDASAEFVMADDFGFYGVVGRTGLRPTDKLSFTLSGRLGVMEFSSDLDDFDAETYGMNFAVAYTDDVLFGRADFGFVYSRFDTGMVFDGTDAVYNPAGRMFYGGADIGLRLNLFSEFYIAPSVGLYFDKADVAGAADNAVFVRGIVDASYKISGDGLDYDYGVRFIANGNGGIGVMARVALWSGWDGAGGDAMIGITHDEYCTAARMSVNLRFTF